MMEEREWKGSKEFNSMVTDGNIKFKCSFYGFIMYFIYGMKKTPMK